MFKDRLKQLSLYSHTLMLLTSIHHVYGAYIYNTHWRLHVLIFSIPAITITAVLTKYLLKKAKPFSNFGFWLYWLIILVLSILLIGTYEGIYNHFIKDILFFVGVDKNILLILFPPPKYEMPNDFLFEFTGLLQAVIAVVLWRSFILLTVHILQKSPELQNTKHNA